RAGQSRWALPGGEPVRRGAARDAACTEGRGARRSSGSAVPLALAGGAAAVALYRRSVDVLEESRQEALAQGGASEIHFRQLVAPVYLDLVNALVESAGRLHGETREAALLVEARATMERFKAAELREYYKDECVADLQAATAGLDEILKS